MDDRAVRLRRMTPAEYETVTERREAETARELAAFLPEELAREGWTVLGLNVFGGNEAAIALYCANGYEVAAMALRKKV
ncbi:N-acetyltransferase [Kitasatospora griseola]|uniref:hypothetical protein n=1 Tax=Kitasatospora griseola TaxID=2064 RepID=UPI0038273236